MNPIIFFKNNRKTILKLWSINITLGFIASLSFQLYDIHQTIQKHNEMFLRTTGLNFDFEFDNMKVGNFKCLSDADCNHGKCVREKDIFDNYKNSSHCDCDSKYVDYDEEMCNYELKEKLTAFLLSFFIGIWGSDWFYLARGCSGKYICLGILKLFTCGGCLIWAFTDWIRILVGTFPDSNGVHLSGWCP